MGAKWNGEFLVWPFECDMTTISNRITEANRLCFLKEYYTRYPHSTPRSELDMDYFEWDPDL